MTSETACEPDVMIAVQAQKVSQAIPHACQLHLAFPTSSESKSSHNNSFYSPPFSITHIKPTINPE